MTTRPSKRPTYSSRYTKYWRHGYRAQEDALGLMRRIQALRAIGYTVPQLAEATGLSTAYLYQLSEGLRSQRIHKRHAEAIRKVYSTLCVQPLHNTASAKRARGWADKAGYFPPMAWDDIDDPTERPSRYEHGRDRTKETARRRELRQRERQQEEAHSQGQ